VKLCVLASGSRGNAILIQAGKTRVVVDAGLSPRTLCARLRTVGVDPMSIEGVVVTHEHTDHVRGAAGAAEKWGWRLIATRGTTEASVSLAGKPVETVRSGSAFLVGDLEFTVIATSHDATEPVAVFATSRCTGERAALVYDLGVMTSELQRGLELSDIVVIESNHDGEMLRNGPYPASVRRRIASRHGHLSNAAAGRAAAECAHRGLRNVVLAHLSEVNNTPGLAAGAMRDALARTVFRGAITTASQDRPTRVFCVSSAKNGGAEQLVLGI